MSRLAVILLVSTGCFYVDPIEQRPTLSISMEGDAAQLVYRGDTLVFDAMSVDPEGQAVALTWRVYLCTDATDFPDGCDDDEDSNHKDVDTQMTVTVPMLREDNVTPVQSLRVIVEATDALGATAKPDQQLSVTIADHAPNLTPYKESRYGYVDGVPIGLFASYGDIDNANADGSPIMLPLVWQVVQTPAEADTYTLVDTTVPQDPNQPTQIQAGKIFTPHGAGDWLVSITATDSLGMGTTMSLPITVATDSPPCLEQWQPIAPLDGTSTLPVGETTLFQIPVVVDDLDVYPPVPGDPVLGTATFAWSILPPGATVRQPLGVTGNSVDFDPSAFTPGDVVELRVQIADRVPRTLTCPDSQLTCSISADQTCFQWLTWRVEVQ